MSLWTPWLTQAQEAIPSYTMEIVEPLDLTKKSEMIFKSEPVFYPVQHQIPEPTVYYQDQYVPLAHISPSSASSCCSGCEVPSPSYPQTLPPTIPQSPSLFSSTMDVDSLSEDPEFQAYERAAMQVLAERNGGSLIASNPRMRRAVETSQAVDDCYRRQRQRNNRAAKMSRDKRKLREINMSLKVSFLKKKVAELKSQLAGAACVRCHKLSVW